MKLLQTMLYKNLLNASICYDTGKTKWEVICASVFIKGFLVKHLNSTYRISFLKLSQNGIEIYYLTLTEGRQCTYLKSLKVLKIRQPQARIVKQKLTLASESRFLLLPWHAEAVFISTYEQRETANEEPESKCF